MKKRILVIDDDELSRFLLRRILERADYEVAEAKNGILGVELFRRERFDLVIVDIFMPKQDGLETIEQIDPDGSRVPVIAMTAAAGTTGADPLQLALTLGASAAFPKDFKDEDLLQTIWKLTHSHAGSAHG